MQENESQRGSDRLTETGELRINVPTAASVAGGSPTAPVSQIAEESPTAPPFTPRLHGRSLAERLSANEVSDEPKTGTFVLPDWSDPPTGLVPRVLLDDEVTEGIEGDLVDVGLRGPSWREDGSDWDNDAGLAFLIEEADEEDQPVIAGRAEPPAASPYEFGFEEIDITLGVTGSEAEVQWEASFGPEAGSPSSVGTDPAGPDPVDLHHGDRAEVPAAPRRRHHREEEIEVSTERSVVVATLVGLGIGAIALACFDFGAPSSIALVGVAVTLAAAELFSSLQRAGYRPATLLGLVAIPVMIVGTYLHGPIAIPFTFILLMIGFAIWGVAGLTHREPVINLGVTALVVSWTGILGSFAGLLLNQSSFPNRNGVALVVGAIALTVAHDVGSFAVGHRFGRHPIAPKVSPGKTREGLVGGTVLTLVVAVALVSHMHPYSLSSAIPLGILVSIFAPLGDLFESVVKRDLGLKDMGRILPAHGGIFDRIDAMLFVIPVCYLLVRAFGLS